MLTVDGRPASIDRDSLEAIWNAPEIVGIRAEMARGEAPEACRICWDHERAGPMSLRTLMNGSVHGIMGADWSLAKLMRDTAQTGHQLSTRPRWYQLQLGNTCNLKCRSCSPTASSRIAADPVHRAWSSTDFFHGHLPPAIQRSAVWYRDPAKIAELMGQNDDEIFLSLLGGEPFLIEEVWDLLHLLVERGWSRRISLGLVSNGTKRRPELEQLVTEFKRVFISVSIDGYGPLFEYLRHGAKWRELVRNLDWLQGLPNISLVATPTLQNTNALGAVKLFRFLDERGINLHFNVLTWPRRLSATNLPRRVRRIAAERLRAYVDEECRPENRSVVQGWAGLLETEDELDPELFREFMLFTNDLDASRGQSLADVDPELFTLLRASGVRWTYERRHTTAAPMVIPSMSRDPEGAIPALPVGMTATPLRMTRVNRTIAPRDAIYASFAKTRAESYFDSGVEQVEAIDSLLRAHGHEGLAACRAVADFAPHYGRITRVLHSCLPHAVVYACDIDRDALEFCERELGASPVVTSWQPDEDELPGDVDVIICISLLTHTPLEHWRRTLRAWHDMLKPGGIVVFTFLSEAYVDRWVAGELEQYGAYSAEQRTSTAQALREHGFAFLPLPGPNYGGESFYGATFARSELVRYEVAAAGFEWLELDAESATFHQSLAVARKTGERDTPAVFEMNGDVRVVALYDPRCYEHDAGESTWSGLVAFQPARPLPTDLGFCDPRVAEVREAQAALAHQHGIDAFCWLYSWSRNGTRWDAPLRELLTSGRPEFPFCLMWASEDGTRVSIDDAEEIMIGLLPYLRDPRYLHVEGRPLLVVRDVAALAAPRATAAKWRETAARHGLGEIHLCAAEPIPAGSFEDLGFDSALELPPTEQAYAEIAAAALARERPAHPLFRSVLCRREPFDARNIEHYELWLRSAIETSSGLVFVRSWNAWTTGAYLEPDDRDGQNFLAATRRAVRGPSSGLVLLRRLRDSLGKLDGSAGQILGELEQVVAVHERSRDELTALVEAAFASSPHVSGSSGQRWVPVAASHLTPSGGRVSIDRFGTATGAELRAAGEPMTLDGEDVTVLGWAHSGDCDPGAVDLFLVLTSASSPDERVYRVHQRNVRPDVVASFPEYPERCGFAGSIPFGELTPGTYRIGIVQRTPAATYYDPTPISVRRE